MKKISIISIILVMLFSFPFAMSASASEVVITAHDLGSSSITVDGDASDWSDVAKSTFVLAQPLKQTTKTFDATVKVAFTSSTVYFLLQVDEKYQAYDFSTGIFDHEATAAMAWAFSINGTGSSRHMGAESEEKLTTSVGYADMVHWELETDAGGPAISGSSDTAVAGVDGGDGAYHLNDDYVTKASNAFRFRDLESQDWTGAWDHSSKTNGSAGTYTFEFSRAWTTDDVHDTQFEMDSKVETTVAFWSPFENEEASDTHGEGWTDSGHFTSSLVQEGFIVFGTPPAASPGFELLITVFALFAIIPIISYKKRN